MREEFIQAMVDNQAAFGLALEDRVIQRLADHFDLVTESNPLLHLTGPSTPEEFAVRHVLESLKMLEFLPEGASFADVGSGAGFPAIPCLIARGDLRGTLIESKAKKAAYLCTAADRLGIADRTTVVNKQFAEVTLERASIVSCRALDKFVAILPRLLRWAGKREYLLFGGPALAEALARLKIEYESHLMPLSDKRFLFVAKK